MKKQDDFVVRGNIVYSCALHVLKMMQDGWLVCRDDVSEEMYPILPKRFRGMPVDDRRRRLIFSKLRAVSARTEIHLARFGYWSRSTLDWLNTRIPRKSEISEPFCVEKEHMGCLRMRDFAGR